MQLQVATDDTALVLDGLRRLVHGLRASSHAVERSLGISGAQLFVLHELAAEPGISIRRLSERTLTDPSSVSTVVSRLVERGLVARKRRATDARTSALALSRKGAALLARAPEPYQGRLIAALRKMPAARLRHFRRGLADLVAALHPEPGAAPLFFESSFSEPETKRRVRR